MFRNISPVGNISNWDTSNVTDMEGLFLYNNDFNQNISNWDTSSVTNMSTMFEGTSFNQPLNSWDTSSVTNMRRMFTDAIFQSAFEFVGYFNVTI